MTKKVVPLKWEDGTEIGTAVIFPDGRAEFIIWDSVPPEILEIIKPKLEFADVSYDREEYRLPKNTMNDQLPETLRPKFRPQKEQ